MDFGTASVAAITVICYLIGLTAKAVPWVGDHCIPILCGLSGGVLGLAGLYLALDGFPAGDPLTAFAVGIASGLAATGADQIKKQLNEKNEKEIDQ